MLELRPLILDENNIVLWWNMRLKALKELWYKKAPVLFAKDLTEEQKKEFIIKDNVWFWQWDFDLLANEWDVEELEDWWVDVPLSDEIDWVEELEEEEIKPYWKWYILIEEDIEKIPEIEKKIKNLWLNYNSSLWN
jgi:hypothetical protein